MCKKILIIIPILILILVGVFFYINNSNINNDIDVILPKEEKTHQNVDLKPQKNDESLNEKITSNNNDVEEVECLKKYTDLYSENNFIPLSAIANMSDIAPNLREKIDEIIDNGFLFYLKKNEDKIFLIVGSLNEEKYVRHDLTFLELTENDVKTLDYFDNLSNDNSKKYNEWIFDKNTELPLSHIKYDDDKNIEYTESWNYSEEEPVKYELKNGEGKTISIKKETVDGNSNIRVEHLLYDELGNIKLNISINYEGPNVTRFTYFNPEKVDDSVTLMYEFDEFGSKIKEEMFSSTYAKLKTFISDFVNGERTSIKINNSKDILIEEILPL